LEERHNIDGIALSSLVDLEIGGFTYCPEKLELVEFISSSAAILKRLVINYETFPAPPLTKEVCEKVRSMCHPNVKALYRLQVFSLSFHHIKSLNTYMEY